MAVAERAAQLGVQVNTIGIGTRGQEISLSRQVRVGLDEKTLQSVASATSGQYFYAADAAQLEQVYAHLGSQIQWVEQQTDVTFIASAAGALLLTVAGGLALMWFGRLP